MKIKERLAKSKARIQAYYNIDLESEEERERLQPKPLEGSYWRRSIMMDGTSIVGEVKLEKERRSVIPNKGQNMQYRNAWDL